MVAYAKYMHKHPLLQLDLPPQQNCINAVPLDYPKMMATLVPLCQQPKLPVWRFLPHMLLTPFIPLTALLCVFSPGSRSLGWLGHPNPFCTILAWGPEGPRCC